MDLSETILLYIMARLTQLNLEQKRGLIRCMGQMAGFATFLNRGMNIRSGECSLVMT
jgi:hypothetical protein